MKVIDLLNKIANGEEVPQMVSYEGKKYHIDELEHFYVSDNRKALLEYIFDYFNDFDALMAEVEIIEEDKKIEKLPIIEEDELYVEYLEINQTRRKINEIIDYLNNKENK